MGMNDRRNHWLGQKRPLDQKYWWVKGTSRIERGTEWVKGTSLIERGTGWVAKIGEPDNVLGKASSSVGPSLFLASAPPLRHSQQRRLPPSTPAEAPLSARAPTAESRGGRAVHPDADEAGRLRVRANPLAVPFSRQIRPRDSNQGDPCARIPLEVPFSHQL